MNKKSMILLIGGGLITTYFILSFFGFYSQPEDFCNYEFHFQYEKQDDYTNPIKQVQQYLLKNYSGEIDVNRIGGYGNDPPKSDPSRPITWVIQINFKLVENLEELELMKQTLENNPKIHDLSGPSDICPVTTNS